MSMILGLYTVSDKTREKILADPPLVWLLIAPDDPQAYLEEVKPKPKPGFLKRLFGPRPAPDPIPDESMIPELDLQPGEGDSTDLDKSWHGIYYLLTGVSGEAQPPLNFLQEGGRELPGIEVGYGPPRLFSSREVKTILQALSQIDENILRSRFDPKDMKKKAIYPDIWDRDPEKDDALGYCLGYFEELKTFLEKCATQNLGLIITLE